ncbi:MAG: hypothetical protein WB677_06265 [Xanthobacteraceae bacterium]
MWSPNDLLFVASVGLILLIAFAMLAIYLIVKVFRLGIRWLRWAVANSAGDAVTTLICLAVAAYFFPRPLTFVPIAAWNFFTSLVSYLPSQLQQQLVFLQSGCNGVSCLNIAVINLSNSWANFLATTFTRVNFGNFPYVDAIFLTAIWLGLTKFLAQSDYRSRIFQTTERQFWKLISGLQSISYTTRLNILLFCVLIVSGYLCLTSIIAIPSLQDSSDSKLTTPADLRSRLEGIILKDSDFDQRFPIELSPDNRLNTELLPSMPDDKISGLPAFADDLKRRFANVELQWRQLRENFRRDQTTVMDLSAQTYQLDNEGRKGERETRQHLLNIEIWYNHWWAQRAGQLSQCKADLERFASSIKSQFEFFQGAIAASNAKSGFGASLPTDVFNELARRLGQAEITAANNCSSRTDPWDIPNRADFGGYLGVFGLAASWLLKTESLPLVLITGLLGFGLLGAACSSVIRNVSTRAAGGPLVPDLAGIIIRGTSAAVLIFLAVFGGLAVFTGGTASPNPYVVLFTCLVAAVFSEDAWAWGAKQFRSRLNRSGRQNHAAAGKPPGH